MRMRGAILSVGLLAVLSVMFGLAVLSEDSDASYASTFGSDSVGADRIVFDANGGYVAVKNDGSVVCYFVYDRVGFMDYLMAHTRLERPSTTRHEYAMIWKTIDGEYKMKLNLQVRFTD